VICLAEAGSQAAQRTISGDHLTDPGGLRAWTRQVSRDGAAAVGKRSQRLQGAPGLQSPMAVKVLYKLIVSYLKIGALYLTLNSILNHDLITRLYNIIS